MSGCLPSLAHLLIHILIKFFSMFYNPSTLSSLSLRAINIDKLISNLIIFSNDRSIFMTRIYLWTFS